MSGLNLQMGNEGARAPYSADSVPGMKPCSPAPAGPGKDICLGAYLQAESFLYFTVYMGLCLRC